MHDGVGSPKNDDDAYSGHLHVYIEICIYYIHVNTYVIQIQKEKQIQKKRELKKGRKTKTQYYKICVD